MGEVRTDSSINNFSDGSHIIGTGGLPTVVLGPGAGAGSVLITGTDSACTITLTAGAGTLHNSIVFTVIFNTPYTTIPHTNFSSANNNTAANTARMFVQNTAVTSFELRITNPALTSGSVYRWVFQTLG